jgi:hypothetical protein
VIIGKPHGLSVEAVDVGGQEPGVPRATEIPVSLVVGHYEDNVRHPVFPPICHLSAPLFLGVLSGTKVPVGAVDQDSPYTRIGTEARSDIYASTGIES